MKIAYLIVAYNNPQQLKRLVSRLHADNTHIFIHLDKKTPDKQYFYDAIKGFQNASFISKSIVVSWGGFSLVQAVLNSLGEILASGQDFDYITLMSGSDYPIKDAGYINDFYLRSSGNEFIHYRQLPIQEFYEGRMDRVWYYYDFDNVSGTFGNPGWPAYENEMRYRGVRRSFIPGMMPYHGSTWWSLTTGCIRYILKVVGDSYEIANFFRYTKFPDEQFFQTLVMNSPYKENAFNENLWYVDWSDNKQPHPKTLGTGDFQALKNSPYLYARKFDMGKGHRILDMLDGVQD